MLIASYAYTHYAYPQFLLYLQEQNIQEKSESTITGTKYTNSVILYLFYSKKYKRLRFIFVRKKIFIDTAFTVDIFENLVQVQERRLYFGRLRSLKGGGAQFPTSDASLSIRSLCLLPGLPYAVSGSSHQRSWVVEDLQAHM